MNDDKSQFDQLMIKLDTMMKLIHNYDMNMKLTLDRVNRIYSYIDKIEKEYDNEKASSNQNNFVQEQKNIVIEPEKFISEINPDENIGQRRVARVPNQPGVENILLSNKKVPIIQRVTDNTGKDLFMAEVRILDTNKELISKTKTTTAGKWQAHLQPGKYFINIVKNDSKSSSKFDSLQEVTIPDSSTTYNLPTIALIKK